MPRQSSPRRPPHFRRSAWRAGFTMLEIVVVLAIVLILTAMGIFMSTDQVPRYRTRKAAMTFASMAQECRSLAVRSGHECSIWLISSDTALATPGSNIGEYWVGLGDATRNSASWDYLPVDVGTSDVDGSEGIVDLSDEDGNYYARNVSIADWGSNINGPGTGNSNRLVFGPQGFLTNPPGDFGANGFIEITFVNKIARSKGVTEDWIARVTRSGMVRLDPTGNDETATLTAGTPMSSSAP